LQAKFQPTEIFRVGTVLNPAEQEILNFKSREVKDRFAPRLNRRALSCSRRKQKISRYLAAQAQLRAILFIRGTEK
jgi:hypothetical protein